eukprot:TRINITY_DN2452_c0_g1_i3.p1 TRINITY_DN2452_c0_g1~~TRINITY_DN2452_c0_g1_i3.p1  ORF type:complete len:635 (+),score=128.28 TRINITY_DN2452_c0_g1_i3:39-1943(+)
MGCRASRVLDVHWGEDDHELRDGRKPPHTISTLSSIPGEASWAERGPACAVARCAGVSRRGVSIRTALALIITAGVLAVGFVAVAPMLIGWLQTTNKFSSVADDAVTTQAASFRKLVVSEAVSSAVSELNTPIHAVDLLQDSCRPTFFQDAPLFNGVADEFHACVRHISINFKDITDLLIAMVNPQKYPGHCFVNKAGQYAIWDDGWSTGLDLYAYNGLEPTTHSIQNYTGWTMYTRPWWPAGVNLTDGTDTWMPPQMSISGKYLLIFYVRQQFHYTTGALVGVYAASYTLVSLQKYFESFPTTENGIAFMVDSGLFMVASVPGYPVANASLTRYYALNHPNATVRNVVRYWLDHLEGGVLAPFSWIESDNYIDVELVSPESGGLRWWLVLVSPQSDFTGNLPKTNHDTLVKVKTIAASVTVADFFVLFVLLAAITMFATLIISPLTRLATQLRLIAHMDFSHSGPAFHSVLTELEDLAHQAQHMSVALKHFSKYVPTAIVKHLIRNQLEPTIGVRREYATVFFLDICDFTKTMDLMGAEAVIDMLQSMFEAFSEILLRKGAVIDKYIGDAIMVFSLYIICVNNLRQLQFHKGCSTNLCGCCGNLTGNRQLEVYFFFHDAKHGSAGILEPAGSD